MSLLQEVLNISRQSSGVGVDVVKNYTQKLGQAGKRAQDAINGKKTPFSTVEAQAEDLAKEDIGEFSQLAALDAMVANAVRFAENAQNTPTPEEQIEAAMKQLREDLTAKESLGEQEIDARIQESLNDIVISMTHTAHPTIFHTLAAKRFQQDLTRILESAENINRDPKTGELSLTQSGQDKLDALYNDPEGFIARLKNGQASITQLEQVTLDEEAAMEKDNWEAITQHIKEVIAAWNEVHKEKTNLQISPDRAQSIIEKRTWLRSADADGRHLSTAQRMYEDIMRDVKDGQYTGEKLDPRQNSQVHLDYMSALIQVKYRNSATGRYGEDATFKEFCNAFMEQRKNEYNQGHDGNTTPWDDPDRSIFQQLTPEHQAEFISQMMQAEPPFKLVPDPIKRQTAEVLGIDYKLMADKDKALSSALEIRRIFLAKYKQEIHAMLLNKNSPLHAKYVEQLRDNADFIDIEYKDMIHVTIPFKKDQAESTVSLRGAFDAVLNLNGFQQGKLEISRRPCSERPSPPIFDFWEYVFLDEIQVGKFLQGSRKWDKTEKKQKRIDEVKHTDIEILHGTTRRMLVLSDAVEKYGERVADRYQIANFEKPADFLIAMKLFEESGLVEMKDGRVEAKPKLDIMPLLETETDLKNAPEIFGALLKNDAARSFWEKSGKATIMLGFSDGSASAGNFASQLAIYNATRDLTELFAKHGIEVEFFEGRGRGTDRGGTLDPALRFELLPPEVTCKGNFQVTIQSDLPMDMAASPAYGKDYLTKILTNTVAYHAKGKETREKLAALNGQHDAVIERDPSETVLKKIADKSSEVYNQLVRGNPEAYEFLINIYDNNQRTSRAASRMEPLSKDELQSLKTIYKKSLTEELAPEEKAKLEKLVDRFDKLRAIQKEYRVNGIDLPMHHAGLKEGLAAAQGDEQFKAASKLPFFRAFAKVADAGLRDFDAEVASKFGQSVGTENFVKGVSESLGGAKLHLKALTSSIVGESYKAKKEFKAFEVEKRVPTFKTHSFTNALDQFSHALTLRLREGLGIKKPEPKSPEEATYRNLLFVNAQEVNKFSTHPVRSQNVGIAA